MTSDTPPLAELAHPLAGTAPREDHADLDPVVEDVDGARVVGLGVATHGTHECFAVLDRLTRALVEDCGVRTLAVEVGPAEAAPLDAFVAAGEGSARAALGRLDDWNWATAGVRSALTWLRSFNADRAPGDRVRVRGVDLCEPVGATERLSADLPADVVEAVRADLDALADGVPSLNVDVAPREQFERAEALGERLGERLDGAAAAADLPEGVRDRIDGIRVGLRRTADWYRTVADVDERPAPDGMAHRDGIVAANVREYLGDDGGPPLALWAHAGHVGRGTFDDGTVWTDVRTAGDRLATALDGRYRPVGTDLVSGRVRALDARADVDNRSPQPFDLGTPPENAVAAALAGADVPLPTYLSLRDADVGTRRARTVGGLYDPDADPETHAVETSLSETFDGLVCLSRTTPSRPLD